MENVPNNLVSPNVVNRYSSYTVVNYCWQIFIIHSCQPRQNIARLVDKTSQLWTIVSLLAVKVDNVINKITSHVLNRVGNKEEIISNAIENLENPHLSIVFVESEFLEPFRPWHVAYNECDVTHPMSSCLDFRQWYGRTTISKILPTNSLTKQLRTVHSY